MRKLFVLAVLMLLASCWALTPPSNEFRKKLQGPPSEFAQHRLPKPEEAAINTEASWHELYFVEAEQGTYVWKGELVVDSPVELHLSIFTPFEDDLDIIVTPPGELPFSTRVAEKTSSLMATRAADGFAPYNPPFTKRSGPFGIDGASFPVTTYTFSEPTQGKWEAKMTIQGARNVPTDRPAVVLMVTNSQGVKLFSHLNAYELEVGQEIGLISSLHTVDDPSIKSRPAPLQLASASASMRILYPDGRKVEVPMHDDGMHSDMNAKDDIYAAMVVALIPGRYIATTHIKGVTADGVAFERSSVHSFTVIEPDITLTGLADVVYNKQDKYFYFNLDVDNYDVDVSRRTIKAYAEVWGTGSSGYEYCPIAWVQAMVDPYTNSDGYRVITLQLHEDWVNKANANAPFQLRNVRLQDRHWNVLLSQRSAVFVDSSLVTSFVPKPVSVSGDHRITEEMSFGPRPAAMRNVSALSKSESKIILVHGYCAGENEFPLAHFTNGVHFKDYEQVRSNDDFAIKILEFGNQYPAFSIVSHSQGGLAATHLHTYYWSNLENAQGGRLVQSVGSPYYGSGLAGNLALIGDIFGIGCGKNNDLTYDGASRWASGIPESTQKDVFYYTTQYNDRLFGGYCVWGASLVLYSPNDGTTELVKAKLKGATDAGHKLGWCHTSGMNHPNQCTDPERNREMDTKASR